MQDIWTTDELVDALRKTPVVLTRLLAEIGADRATRRPAAGEWSAVEIVGHLVDAEERAVARIALIVENDGPELAGYDADALVRERAYQQQPLQSVLDRFLALRAERIAALAALAPDQWRRTGDFMGRGSTPLTAITVHMIWHNANHLAQLAETLGVN